MSTWSIIIPHKEREYYVLSNTFAWKWQTVSPPTPQTNWNVDSVHWNEEPEWDTPTVTPL
jgi:hypothetical protein